LMKFARKMITVAIRPNKNEKEVAKKNFIHIMPVPCLFIEVNAPAIELTNSAVLNQRQLFNLAR